MSRCRRSPDPTSASGPCSTGRGPTTRELVRGGTLADLEPSAAVFINNRTALAVARKGGVLLAIEGTCQVLAIALDADRRAWMARMSEAELLRLQETLVGERRWPGE